MMKKLWGWRRICSSTSCMVFLSITMISSWELGLILHSLLYAPWIMRFLRTRSSLNYKADFQNHVSYLPLIEVLKRTFSSSDEKGKATTIIDEGIRPLDGQFRKATSYSTNDDCHPWLCRQRNQAKSSRHSSHGDDWPWASPQSSPEGWSQSQMGQASVLFNSSQHALLGKGL